MAAGALLFALLLQTAGRAAPQGASISGRVTDKASGQPLPRMVVAVVSADRAKQAETTTDAEGRYRFDGLAAGKYAVGADNDDHVATYLRQWFGIDQSSDVFSPPPSPNIELAAGETRGNVDVALTRALAIEGHVFDPLGEPVSDMEVSATSADGQTPGLRVARTDDRGAYRVFGLRAGQYRVCGLPSFRMPPEPGTVPTTRTCYPDLAVTSQDSFNIDIYMQAAERATPDTTAVPDSAPADARDAGAIHGVVVDQQTGRPIARAIVRLGFHGSSQRPGDLATTTNADGVFAFAALTPGEYDGFATASGHELGILRDAENNTRVTVQKGAPLQLVARLPRAYDVAVRMVDAFGTPLSGIGVSLQPFGPGSTVPSFRYSSDDLGRVRVGGISPGRYRICAEPGSTTGSPRGAPSKRERLLRTCYPAASADADALPITIENADADIEIRLQRGRTFSVSGTLLDAAGQPASHALAGLAKYFVNGSSTSSVEVRLDGRFQLQNLQPGAYAIVATTSTEAAFVPVRVDDDIDGLVIAMRKTVNVIGHVITDDASAPPPSPAGRAPLVITARLADDRLPNIGSGLTGTANSDGTFALDGLFGVRRVDVMNAPTGWYVKAVRLGGRDVTDAPVEFKDGQQLEIVLSSHGGILGGTVGDVIDKRATRARVALLSVPADKDVAPRLAGSVMSVTGNFRFGPLRAGTYAIVAIPASEPAPRPDDGERLAQLAALGERVTLTELDQRTIDLRIVSAR